MRACTDDDSSFGACANVDVSRAAPRLAQQPQIRQLLDEFAGKTAALADRHDRFDVAQTLRKLSEIRGGIAITDDFVSLQCPETLQSVDYVLVVVGDCDSH
jgi:hypothetical protein